MAMNPHDRHQAVILGETPDRVDVIASTSLRTGSQGGWMRRLMKRGLCITHIVPPYRPNFFFPGDVNPYLKDVVYSQISFYEEGIWKLRHQFETPVGVVESTVRRNLDIAVSGDSAETHFVKEAADWKVVNDIFRKMIAAMRPNYAEMLRDQDELGENGYTIAVVDRTPYQRGWIELASLEQTVIDSKEKPEGFLEYIEIQQAFHKKAAEFAAGCPSDHVLLIDNITNTISPRLYREYCLPYYQIYADAFQGTDKILAVHHDGLFAHLKKEIADAAFDVIDSFTVPPSGNVSLSEAKTLFPGKMPFVNLPPHLAYAGPEELREAYSQIAAEWGSLRLVVEHVEDFPLEQVEAHLSAALDAYGY